MRTLPWLWDRRCPGIPDIVRTEVFFRHQVEVFCVRNPGVHAFFNPVEASRQDRRAGKVWVGRANRTGRPSYRQQAAHGDTKDTGPAC